MSLPNEDGHDFEVVVGVIDHDAPYPYGEQPTYEIGARFLEPCRLVEDWGCGRGWLRHFIEPERYRGIDMGVDGVPGESHFADRTADLTVYRSDVPGIFMRHVLMHNYDWEKILANALLSASERLYIADGTPWAEYDENEILFLAEPPEYPQCADRPVPTLAFSKARFMKVVMETVEPQSVEIEELTNGTWFGMEKIIKVLL